MKKLRMLQVGTGGWGRTWLDFLVRSPAWELAGLVSRGGANLEWARAKTGLPESACFTDLETALDTDVDAVLITVPHHLHVPYAHQALERGKHVLCEKPFSDDYAAARDLVAFADTTGCVLGVSQNFRYRLGLHQLRSLAAAGAGAIDSMQVDIREPQACAGKGWREAQTMSPLLLEVLIHQVDMARFLCGADPVSVYSRAWNPEWSVSRGPASADVLIDYTDGSRLTYCGTWATRGGNTPWDGEWRVRYEHAVATWAGGMVTVLPADQQGDLGVPESLDFPGHDRAGVLADFAKAVLGEAPFATDGRDNLCSLAIIFAAMKSAEEHRSVLIEEIMEA